MHDATAQKDIHPNSSSSPSPPSSSHAITADSVSLFSSFSSEPGPKKRGRVAVDIEFLQDRSKRRTTFSKRKQGLMKKAYDLSVLTGAEILVLVAPRPEDSSHYLYSFSTQKLRPIITSPKGQAIVGTLFGIDDNDGPEGSIVMSPSPLRSTGRPRKTVRRSAPSVALPMSQSVSIVPIPSAAETTPIVPSSASCPNLPAAATAAVDPLISLLEMEDWVSSVDIDAALAAAGAK